jgi:hypothetical protein
MNWQRLKNRPFNKTENEIWQDYSMDNTRQVKTKNQTYKYDNLNHPILTMASRAEREGRGLHTRPWAVEDC